MQNVLILGTNDIATATAIKLWRCGFKVTMIGCDTPADIFYHRNFSSALFIGKKTILSVTAITLSFFLSETMDNADPDVNHFIKFTQKDRRIPIVLVDETRRMDFSDYKYVLCLEKDLSTLLDFQGKTRIGLTSYMQISCDYFVFDEGNYLGQVKYPFNDYPLEQGVSGHKPALVLSKASGVFFTEKSVADKVSKDEVIASVNDTPIVAPADGIIAGLAPPGKIVDKGNVLTAIQPMDSPSPKIIPLASYSIAGGILEALLFDTRNK